MEDCVQTNGIHIREAEESDLPAIEELVLELADAMDCRDGIDVDGVYERCCDILNEVNSCILVAEADGAVVGFINFTTRKTLLHSAPSALIDELVVAGSFRSKGLGRELLNAAVEKCRQLGCCEVEVSTEFTNTGAREFYKRCGFQERGVILEKDLEKD